MAWLQSLDVALFRFLNQSIANPAFDWLMPLFNDTSKFVPVIVLSLGALAWRGGRRGRICALFILAAMFFADGVVSNSLKSLIDRKRPYHDIPETRLLVGEGKKASMPSAHAANAFAAAMVAFVFYRRSGWIGFPLAGLVALSRVSVGVHYPSDVAVGGILGMGTALGVVTVAGESWRAIGRRWFRPWWDRLPLLTRPEVEMPGAATETAAEATNQLWTRLGYLLVGGALCLRLGYLAAGIIELSEDEAYQWTWSKHLALSYYSKPPMIALLQRAGTTLFGDTAFGVRFFSPVLAALTSLVLLRFLGREVSPRAGFWVVAVSYCAPLLAIGAALMTVDPPLALFWMAGVATGWRAMQADGRTRDWAWTGLWLGLGFLSKYTALFQILCFAMAFGMLPKSRQHLRKVGPYLALAILAVCTIPVVIWNQQHDWITASHVATNAKLDREWHFTLNYFIDFVAAEAGLLHPVFFVAMLGTLVTFWRRRTDLKIFLFCMGAPVFLGYWLYTFHSRVLPNWIAPAVLPLFCLMVADWEPRWKNAPRWVRGFFVGGVALGIVATVILHETGLIRKIAGRPLPAKIDPLRRVRGWSEMARVVEEVRQEAAAEAGKPPFIIGEHYGITGLLSFYIPEAKAKVAAEPLVYYRTSGRPENQFYFWPGYTERKGESALYVRYANPGAPIPESVQREFSSVRPLGSRAIVRRGMTLRTIELFECRDLR